MPRFSGLRACLQPLAFGAAVSGEGFDPNGVNPFTEFAADPPLPPAEATTGAGPEVAPVDSPPPPAEVVQPAKNRGMPRLLTNDQAAEVRRRKAAGESLKALAKAYGVSNGSVEALVTGRTYADAEGPRHVQKKHRRRHQRSEAAAPPVAARSLLDRALAVRRISGRPARPLQTGAVDLAIALLEDRVSLVQAATAIGCSKQHVYQWVYSTLRVAFMSKALRVRP